MLDDFEAGHEIETLVRANDLLQRAAPVVDREPARSGMRPGDPDVLGRHVDCGDRAAAAGERLGEQPDRAPDIEHGEPRERPPRRRPPQRPRPLRDPPRAERVDHVERPHRPGRIPEPGRLTVVERLLAPGRAAHRGAANAVSISAAMSRCASRCSANVSSTRSIRSE